LIWLKATAPDSGYGSGMPRAPRLPGLPSSHAANGAQRLLAHAKLCREVAARSWNEESAEKLEKLADACIRAAGAAFEPPSGQLH
jgi:hypothetical protein